MSANTFKRLNVSDNFVVPYTANKTWDILSSSFAEKNITVNVGVNTTNSLFDPINEYKTNGQYDRLVYNSVNLVYYPEFLPYLISTQSLQNTVYNDGTLATSSYFNGHVNLGNLDTIKFYPTGNGSTIYAINVPRSLTSDKILPTTFEVDFESGSNTYKLYDDGNYNLLYSGSNISSSIGTVLSQSSYVGNVFYEQNIVILTIIPDSVRLRGWRGINPYCLQASPSPTPSVTPTVTVTPSITVTPSVTQTPSLTPSLTPTITPTISVTPSVTNSVPLTPTPTKTLPPTVTPTPTITVTPSTSLPTYQFQVRNQTTGNNNITDIITIDDIIFYQYNPRDGYLPVPPGGRLFGAGNTSSEILVTIDGSSTSSTLYLYKNNSVVDSASVTGPGTYSLGPITYRVNDYMRIELV